MRPYFSAVMWAWAASSGVAEILVPLGTTAAVARWTGLDGNAFRQGRHWRGFVTTGDHGELVDAEQAERLANAALGERGPLTPLLTWMRRLPIDANSAPRSTTTCCCSTPQCPAAVA